MARPGVQPDTPETRSLGWKRMSLLVLYFNPADLLKPQVGVYGGPFVFLCYLIVCFRSCCALLSAAV